MKESKFKPDGRAPDGAGAVIYETAEEALDELLRRIMVLGQAPYVYSGLAIRLASGAALDIQDTAMHDPRFPHHRSYGATVDVFETPDGFHVSVDETMERAVLRAELGTTRIPLQPLWGPRGRREDRGAFTSGVDLAEIVAQKAGTGHALVDSDINAVRPLVQPESQPGLDSLRQIMKDRQALMAKEEA